MKKKSIINLIRYYSESNDTAFRNEAYQIAQEFDQSGDSQLAEYILALLSNTNTFIPQNVDTSLQFLQKVIYTPSPLPLPDVIKDDVMGLVHAVGYNIGINKYLFSGAPGTGKTETAKQVARLLDRDLFLVHFESIIDSRLGMTAKNIADLFEEINHFAAPSKAIILFDELDALAMRRSDHNDIREMGRATSALLKGFDILNPDIVIIATTNLEDSFDKALLRRFDSIISFNRYTQEDLLDISELLLDQYLKIFNYAGRNLRLFRKIMQLNRPLPYPGDLKNMIKSALAFSAPDKPFDYLVRLYRSSTNITALNLNTLQEQGFTVREMEILTGISKSTISRELKGE